MENVNLDTVIAYKQGGKKISFLDGYDGDNPSGHAIGVTAPLDEQGEPKRRRAVWLPCVRGVGSP